nr:uncharacterized protein LOC113391735 [Vanessa tameamea]
MPNKYKKKKTPRYTQDDITNAIQEVNDGKLSMYAAAHKYGIPTTTLYDKIKATYSTNVVGRPLAIPLEVENRLVDAIKTMEKWGFGLSREEVLNLVAEFVKSNNLHTPFTNNKPGKDWFINFRKRHRLSIKKPQPVEYVRKKMTDPFVIFEYFKLLEDTLSALNLFQSPHLIWNMDETSLSLDPTKTKVVGAINKPCSRTTCGTGKENTTILTTVSASGKKLSPLIVFKGKNIWDQWMGTTENFDFELSYAASSKGWMETAIFYNYMEKVLIPALGDERPVLIIYDGHSTHVDAKVIELAIKNDVTILKLPPHTSHLLQPLDVAVFKSFKSKWDRKLVEWQRHNVGIKMPKKVFAQTLAETWQDTSPDVIRNGFKKAGIYPFDSHVIPQDKYDPAAYKRYKESEHYRTQAHSSLKSPRSLNELCVDFFNEIPQTAKKIQIHKQGLNTNSVSFLSTLSKTNEQTKPFLAKSTSMLPKCLQNTHSQTKEKVKHKITIISDIKVNFEEILLDKIRQDKKDNIYIKKKRISKGAEVITASIIKKNTEENEIPKTKKRVSKDKEKNKSPIANLTSRFKKTKNKKRRKTKFEQLDSNSSTTSISDIMSVYSEIGFDYSDNECFIDEFWDDTQIEEIEVKPHEVECKNPKNQDIICNISEERKILTMDLNKQNKKNGKGTGKKTKIGKENDIHEYVKTDKVCRNNDETENNNETENSDKTKKEESTKNLKRMPNLDEVVIKENDEKKEEYLLKDAVLVRYFSKKKWTYYIGFIENIFQKNNETYYTVDFLKTIKKPTLKFVQSKRKDRDEITELLIIKKVDLKKSNRNDREFHLLDENNKVYFD